MNKLDEWKIEEDFPFKGWDFSHLEGRWDNEKLSWDYSEIILQYLNPKMNLLDMDTGDGKFLLTLNHPYSNTFVTEGYPLNYDLCIKTLSPLGINVQKSREDNVINYSNNLFDIIINRHGSFSIDEVYRTLKPNGLFITQQVGGLNNNGLSKKIIDNFEPKYIENNLHNIQENLIKKDFTILQSKEEFPKIKFYDIGAFVYFAKIIEWEFPNFSVIQHYNKLLELEKEISIKGYLEGLEHRFFVVARKLSYN